MPEFDGVDRQAVFNAAWLLQQRGERPTLTALQLQFGSVPEAQLQSWLELWAEQQQALTALPELPPDLAVLGQRLYAELAPALVEHGRQQTDRCVSPTPPRRASCHRLTSWAAGPRRGSDW